MQHGSRSESTQRNRLTTAPYNFIPLPDAIQDAFDEPGFSRFFKGKYSGEITYTATTLTPLYTRCAENISSNKQHDDRQFFHHGNNQKPYLPGSSIKGMLRSIVTILSSSKLPECKDRHLFFRSFQRGVMADIYTRKFSQNMGRVKGPLGELQAFKCLSESGFLTEENGVSYFTPCHELRIARRKMPISLNDLYVMSRTGDKVRVPNPKYQYTNVWVKVDDLKKDWSAHRGKSGPGMYSLRRDINEIRLDNPSEQGWHRGIMVITGDVPKKSAEFVFVEDPQSVRVPIPSDVMQHAQDKDQISFWQERAFEKSEGRFEVSEVCRNEENSFSNSVILTDGRGALPVWILRDQKDNRKIIGIGRAQNFRLRFEHGTGDFVPEINREERLDFAEALFGTIRKNAKRNFSETDQMKQVRSRLRFEDADCTTDLPWIQHPDANNGVVVPQILAGPKPTAFQNYLVQPEFDENKLIHYSSSSKEGKIRGFKNYWHRNTTGKEGRIPLSHHEMFRKVASVGKQDTEFKPVCEGSVFKGKVKFDNLALPELGALIAAIELPEDHAHKLGMGKPIGMGSIRFSIDNLKIIDRPKRYSSWNSTESVEDIGTELIKTASMAFNQVIVRFYNETYGQSLPEDTSLWSLPRNAMLSMMLDWGSAPPSNETRYVGLSGDDSKSWRERRVLPSPIKVMKNYQPYIVSAKFKTGASSITTAQHPSMVLSRSSASSPNTELGNLFGQQTMRLVKNLGNNSWSAFHPETDKEYEILKVKPQDHPEKEKWVDVFVRMNKGKQECTYIKMAKIPAPDLLLDESKAEATVMKIDGDKVLGKILGGNRIWEIKGIETNCQVKVNDTISVRVIRKNGEYLAVIK